MDLRVELSPVTGKWNILTSDNHIVAQGFNDKDDAKRAAHLMELLTGQR